MRLVNKIKEGIKYVGNQEIDIQIRMLFLLEYTVLIACIIGTITMIAFVDSFVVLIPNFALLFFSALGLYFTHVKKKYELAANLIIIGCAYIALPVMYFTAGGNDSGMPIWFVFGVVFSCLMAKGKSRVVMSLISILISATCLWLGFAHKEWIIPLKGENAAFYDMFQSYMLVSVVTCISLIVYLSTYDAQRRKLEFQSAELARINNVDALTGIANRRAYYADTNSYRENGLEENLVLVAMDVNGLKSVNDTYGHSEGDFFIQTASKIIVNAFSKYGKIYRTGGDEFLAVLNCENNDAKRLEEYLKKAISASADRWAENMSIAMGVMLWNENKAMGYSELEKQADVLMYQNKSEYYRNSGKDRRRS